MIDRSIQVLAVDDEADFCVLTKSFLERFPSLEVDIAYSAREAMDKLATKRYDVIVSDYQMPEMDGIQFLKSLRAAGDEIPFILFTGKGREEVVIEALNNGANSYLQKGGKALPQYTELQHRVLEVVQRHRGKQDLLESEARFEQLTKHSGIVIWEIDANGLFTYVSGASETVWGGYRPEELIGKKHFYDLTPETDRESFRAKVFEMIRRKERFVNIENPVLGKGREVKWVSTNGIPMLNSDGSLRVYRGSDTDVTERKQSEKALSESEQVIQGIIKAIPVRVFWKDKNLVYLGCNEAFARDAGFTDPKEIIGKDDYQMVWRDQAEQYRGDDRHVIESGLAKLSIEEPQKTPNGEIITLLTNKIPLLSAEGEIMGVLGTYMEITERKRMEDALQASERMLTDIIDFLPDATFVIDLEGKVVAWNKAIEQMTGVSKEEMIGQGDHAFSIPFYGSRRHQLLDLLTLDDEELKQNYDYVTRVGKSLYAETFCNALNGGKGAKVWATATSMFDEQGNRVGGIESIRDITERKRVEEALRESVQRYELVMEGSSAGLWDSDVVNKRIHFSSHWKAMRGYADAEIGDSQTEWTSRIHPDDAPRVIEALQAHFNGRTDLYEAEYRVRRKDGSYIWVLDRGKAVRDASGKVIRNVGSEIDITQRKQAEDALKESVQRYELVMEGSSAGLWDWDVPNHRIQFSSRWKAMRGYSDSEIGESEMEWSSRLHPEDELRVMAALQAHFDGLTDFYEEEYRVICKDGSTKWILDRGKAVRDANGQVIRAAGSEIDITERKKMDLQIKERIKELGAFYSLAEMAEREGLKLKELYQEITNILPNSWRYPEAAYARAVIKESEFRTENYQKTPWVMAAPIKVSGQIIGRIEVGYLDERPELDEGPFSREERRLVDAIAERIGHITGRKWIENELQLSNAKLGILNNITRHDITNQMMVLNGFLELIKQREKDDELTQYLSKMSHAAAIVREQIVFMKDYQELGIKAPAWASVGQRISEAFALLHPPGITLEDATGGVEVLTDPLADKVPYNLVDNSMRHGGKVTRIRMSAQQLGESLVIVYEDDGVGINAEDRKHLFEKGFGKNTGYGLFLVREILAMTGITIHENGWAGKGVRFEMLVPAGAWRRAPSK